MEKGTKDGLQTIDLDRRDTPDHVRLDDLIAVAEMVSDRTDRRPGDVGISVPRGCRGYGGSLPR